MLWKFTFCVHCWFHLRSAGHHQSMSHQSCERTPSCSRRGQGWRCRQDSEIGFVSKVDSGQLELGFHQPSPPQKGPQRPPLCEGCERTPPAHEVHWKTESNKGRFVSKVDARGTTAVLGASPTITATKGPQRLLLREGFKESIMWCFCEVCHGSFVFLLLSF